jgi:hypothetical protein
MVTSSSLFQHAILWIQNPAIQEVPILSFIGFKITISGILLFILSHKRAEKKKKQILEEILKDEQNPLMISLKSNGIYFITRFLDFILCFKILPSMIALHSFMVLIHQGIEILLLS